MAKHGPYTYRVEEADLAAAGQLFFRRRLSQPPARYLLIALVLCAVLLIGFDIVEDGAINLLSLVSLGIGLPLVWFVPHLLAPVMMRRQYHQSAALRDEQTFEFDEEALFFTSSRAHVRLPFDELYAWAQTGKLVLLSQTEAYFVSVPKEALGDDTARLIANLTRAGVKRF